MVLLPVAKSRPLAEMGDVTVYTVPSLLSDTTELLTLKAASNWARVMADMSWLEV